ncbi:hypothetical protein BLA24_19715 [Streptomyces cinnamoneus]|uniref:Secreted protein n=1 Tax=Streptomyces cinnamoneus TaxID=53446 RepID=A0A2G1XF60_STRCJ|nr:hypothetical protein [Streptomyces cinnamoneus]PHQ49870.1 hypothetical protein BLA24_19715 [Streptomyces cinnamoneus]PPT13354.1 hypothetical protein CYQ11_11080 [Streptomyces cinnamoneus]
MPARRRLAVTGTALAAALAVIPLATGCDAAKKAVDCARVGVEITGNADDLQRTVSDANGTSDAADKILDTLDRDTKKLKEKTDNVDVRKVLDHLQQALTNVRDALRDDRKPDLTPLKDAAGELGKVCTRD